VEEYFLLPSQKSPYTSVGLHHCPSYLITTVTARCYLASPYSPRLRYCPTLTFPLVIPGTVTNRDAGLQTRLGIFTHISWCFFYDNYLAPQFDLSIHGQLKKKKCHIHMSLFSYAFIQVAAVVIGVLEAGCYW
jgi:hypothetical protein